MERVFGALPRYDAAFNEPSFATGQTRNDIQQVHAKMFRIVRMIDEPLMTNGISIGTVRFIKSDEM